MAASSSSNTDTDELIDILLSNQESPLTIVKEKGCNFNVDGIEDYDYAFMPNCLVKTLDIDLYNQWGKSLSKMPLFTIKDIEEHRLRSGKSRDTAIMKSLVKGRKFKEERYLTADDIYTQSDEALFYVKGLCKASMKKEKKSTRNLLVHLDKTTGSVQYANCNCPAGECGYCHHVMALLLELADYSLNLLQVVPEEIACTSRARQWGCPTESSTKAPVMSTSIQKRPSKRGVQCTLYDPTRVERPEKLRSRKEELQKCLIKLDGKKISFPLAILNNKNSKLVTNSFGQFDALSPLGYQLNPVGFVHEIITDLTKLQFYNQTFEDDYVNLPCQFISKGSGVIPIWKLNDDQSKYIKSITVKNEDSCYRLETDSSDQIRSSLWSFVQNKKITSSNVHKVYIRKKQFKTIVPDFLTNESKERQNIPKEALKHEQVCNEEVMGYYENVLRFHLHRDVDCRSAGCVVQPLLPWIVATPYAFMSDRSKSGERFGVICIYSPYRKRDSTAKELLADRTFCVERRDGKLVLKKEHHDGYFTRMQIEMGLCGVSYGDFLVYTFHSLIVVRVPFDGNFFMDVLKKVNDFYINHLLPSIMESNISNEN